MFTKPFVKIPTSIAGTTMNEYSLQGSTPKTRQPWMSVKTKNEPPGNKSNRKLAIQRILKSIARRLAPSCASRRATSDSALHYRHSISWNATRHEHTCIHAICLIHLQKSMPWRLKQMRMSRVPTDLCICCLVVGILQNKLRHVPLPLRPRM